MTKPHSLIPRLLSPREAVDEIFDGATIAVSGFGITGLAQTLHLALLQRFQQTGAPRDLTYIHAAGHCDGYGLDLLAPHGLVRRVIGGHWGLMPALRQAISEEKIEAHNWPQGVVIGALRAAANGEKHGLKTRIGLGTFIDPRHGGGCANATARAQGSLIRLIEQDGEECLNYAPLQPNFALIRGWSADKLGNVALGLEPLNLSPDVTAMAARHHGGKVICQVRHIEPDVIYSADRVAVPGFLIDALVLAENPEIEHRQCPAYDAHPALISAGGSDEIPTPAPQVPEGARGWIGRRAAQEIHDGEVFNLGIGIPGDAVGAALYEAGRLERTVSTIESGIFGGVALGGINFGLALYPHARLDQAAMFDMYHGGGLDVAVMGAAQIDGQGNINVSQFNHRAVGCGGFINITQSARRIIFCSTLTAGGLDVRWEQNALRIVAEGRHRKFVSQLEQITFNGQRALKNQQVVQLITERAVFELTPDGWNLIEVAPGINAQRDILPQMDFTPLLAPDLKPMPIACFEAGGSG